MAQDIWYESATKKGFVNLTGAGKFTLNGANIYATSTPDVSVTVDNFSGKATFLGVNMNGKFIVKGEGTNTSALAMGMQFNSQNAYSNTSAKAKAAMLNSRIYNGGSYPLSNIGTTDAAFIRSMLEQVRTERPSYKTTANGIILHRIKIYQTKIGIRLLPASATTGSPIANQAPVINLTSPANNASYTAPASVTMTATASDGDGTVSKVEFYNGSTKLGEDLSSPYSFTWNNVAAGNYALTAKAIDERSMQW